MVYKFSEEQIDQIVKQSDYEIVDEGDDMFRFKFFLDGQQVGFIAYKTFEENAQVMASSITRKRGSGYPMYKAFIDYLKNNNFNKFMSDDTIEHPAIHRIWQKLGAHYTGNIYVLKL